MSTLKHKGKGPQAMTANELRDGYSVWLDENLDWTWAASALPREVPDEGPFLRHS